MVRAVCLIACCAALSAPAAAAERTVRAAQTTEPIVLDGVLDEAGWQLVEAATGFVQAEPRQGTPVSERTEVRVLFDADSLYFGVACLDRTPEGILARSLRIDFSPVEEDFFQILIDPFASAREGFLFTINPNGAKRDEQISNGGRESNVSWDAVWDVRTHRDATGWTAEIRIPFRTLRYDRNDSRSWNVNFGRQIRRRNEIAYWSEIPRQFNIRQVGLAGHLSGLSLQDLRGGRNLRITPYAVLNGVDRAGDSTVDKDFGVDVKYGVTSGLTLDLTYNTDFSHVEVDQQVVNLDRFRLSFPEQRDFFLENAGIFEIGSVAAITRGLAENPLVFYSRNVGLSLDGRPVPIKGGGRLTGRVGHYSLGLMSIQTDEGEDQGPENATVVRVKRDLLARSYVGAFFLNRDGSRRDSNQVFGVDGLYRPRSSLTFNGYFAKSQVPGIKGDDWLLRVEGLYDTRRMLLNITHANIQEGYRNDLGFLTRKGVEANRLEWRPRIRPWQGGPVRELQGIVNIRYTPDSRGRLVTREQSTGLDVFFQDGMFMRYRRRNFFERLDQDFEIRRGVLIGPGDYNFYESGVEFNTNRSRTFSGSTTWYTGEFWSGEKTSWDVAGQFRPSGHLSTELTFSRDLVTLPTGRFEAILSGLRIRYSLNTRTFADVFVQYNNERDRVTSNIRFNWIHRPLSDLFVVYTEERPTVGSTQTDRVLSLKYTHLLDF